jgi:hypothetical protein
VTALEYLFSTPAGHAIFIISVFVVVCWHLSSSNFLSLNLVERIFIVQHAYIHPPFICELTKQVCIEPYQLRQGF